MGQFLFHVPLRGNVALLFGVASIFLVGVLAMGMLISIVTKSQLLASQLAMMATFLPSFLLSGFIFAIANMPRPIQWITYLVPARYFVSILKGIYLKGVGLEILATDALLLVAFGAVMVLVARWKFKKKWCNPCSTASVNMLIKEFIQVFRDPRMRGVVLHHALHPSAGDRLRGEHGRPRHARRASTIWTTAGQPRACCRVSSGRGYFDVVARIDNDRQMRRPGRPQPTCRSCLRVDHGFGGDLEAGRTARLPGHLSTAPTRTPPASP